jgi:trans-aconitate methyltransferase
MQPRAKTFNEDAELYDRMRPGYPEVIFKQLQKSAGLSQTSRVLEVGCGTGQATKSLINFTRNITCLEPGKALLRVAKQNLPDLEFANTTFEAFKTRQNFDCIFSATAWHWVDPQIGYLHARELLSNLGCLAVLRNYHVETNPDAFLNQAQFIFAKYSGSSKKPDLTSRDQIDSARKDMENNYFHLVGEYECPWQQTYSIDDYIALRNTYSPHRSMDTAARTALENELRTFANSSFDGRVSQSYSAILFVSKKKD